MRARSLFDPATEHRLEPGRLPIEHQVYLASRVVHLPAMLAAARADGAADAARALKDANMCVGGSMDPGWFATGPGGVYYSPTHVTPDAKTASASVSWARIAELVGLGLTAGLAAAGSAAYRRYIDLHGGPFQHVNAVSDPLAWRTIYMPEYLRTTATMRAVANAVWGNAIAAVCGLDLRLTLR